MICAACKNEFKDTDNGLFKTCHACRHPDTAKHKAPRFGMGGGGRGRTAEHKENTRETKFGPEQR